MMARLGAIAVERGLESVEAPITRTERNEPARRFLANIGGSEDGSIFRAKDLADLTYAPGGEAEASEGAAELRQLEEKDREKTVDFARIASCLSTAEQVLAAVKAGRVAEGPIHTSTDEPRTETEARVAKIWADLLHRTSVGVNDNFFDLGGHSLLAVQLLSIVNQVFGVDLSLKVVYAADFTVAELAKAIELEHLGGVGADEYAELLEELEGLTDEEAEALLAAETDVLPGENPRS
jgi:acyl carrier protein